MVIIIAVVLAGAIVMLVDVLHVVGDRSVRNLGLAAGLLLGLMATLGVVLFAWLITRHYWRPLDLIH
jgi:hypothetical protein